MQILNLGLHPFADSFIPKGKLSESEPLYPLTVHLEKDGYIHLESITDDRYNLYDYSYTSANSAFSRNHWTSFAKMIFDKDLVNKDSNIVEIGSNDGFLLKIIKLSCPNILGVDASKTMTDVANKNGVKTLNYMFGHSSAKEIKKLNGAADLIIANNVFNHADDPVDFLSGVCILLNKSGSFICEVPDWYYTIKTFKFDQIYHEHRTYFTAKYLYKLFKEQGMQITEISEIKYHGGSLRVIAKKSDSIKKNKNLSKLIKREEKAGLFKKETYDKYMNLINKKRSKTLSEIYNLKQKGFVIIAVGAAAKANTFLNFYNLDFKTLDYVTDSSPYKIGKHTPFTRIPIGPDSVISKYKKVCVIVTSWNLDLNEILLKINPKIKFIKI